MRIQIEPRRNEKNRIQLPVLVSIIMNWLRESDFSWFQRFSIRLIQCGPIPKHIAFILDGNWINGPTDKLVKVLQWCLNIGVREVTVYAFSIENFSRNKEELEAFLKLATDNLQKLIDDEDQLNERGICVRFVGNLSLLPIDLQCKMAKVMLMTRSNGRAVCNIAIAHTSRDEMTESVRTIINGVQQSELNVEDISDDLFKQCMHMSKTCNPDLIVRTSGETRLSDFLLYQCATSIIYYSDTLWPEFGMWQVLALIFYYQQHELGMVQARRCLDSYAEKTTNDEQTRQRIESFIDRNEKRRIKFLEDLIKVDLNSVTDVESTRFKKN